MISPKPASDSFVYQLKVTLRDSHPPIWRRFQVTSEITLHKLHQVLQEVMGWENYHLYLFRIEGTEYSDPNPEWGLEEMKNAKRAKLTQVIPGEKTKFLYEYDFGDSWEHTILVEKLLPQEPETRYPVCLAGKWACPPEDCGGIGGYYHFLEVLQSPADPEHEDMLAWVGGNFDPQAFDLDQVNQRLRRIK